MKEYIKMEEIPLKIEIQSYKNSKSIKVIYKDGFIKVTKPKWYSTYNIKKYLKDNAKEIYNRYLESQEILCNNENRDKVSKMLFKGKLYDIVINKWDKKKVEVDIKENFFEISIYDKLENEQENELMNLAIKNLLKKISKTYIINKVEEISVKIGIGYNNIKIKDCKTIWGSCSNKGNLNFNYKLIQMPEWVIESIIIHELCHRKYLNHSKDFWNLVFTYFPREKYAQAKKWIKENGIYFK